MKTFAVFALLVAPVFSATWEQLPPAWIFDGVDLESIEPHFDTLHPWKAGDPLPTCFKDAGLESPVALVAGNVYLDGGSQFYLFRGANGKYLVLCTDTHNYDEYDSQNHSKTVHVDKPRLYLGVSHFSNKNRVVVPYDSKCEHFLVAAIQSEVERIDKLSKDQSAKPTGASSPRG